MKRRTREHVDVWPNMRADTLKAISEELIRARQKHIKRDGNLNMLLLSVSTFQHEIGQYEDGKMSASQIYARCAMIAAMAIRYLEEGSYQSRYAGNTQAPEFRLEP